MIVMLKTTLSMWKAAYDSQMELAASEYTQIYTIHIIYQIRNTYLFI